MASRIGCCVVVATLVFVLLGCGHEPRSGQLAAGHRALKGDVSTPEGTSDPRQRGMVLGKRGQHDQSAPGTGGVDMGGAAGGPSEETEDDG